MYIEAMIWQIVIRRTRHALLAFVASIGRPRAAAGPVVRISRAQWNKCIEDRRMTSKMTAQRTMPSVAWSAFITALQMVQFRCRLSGQWCSPWRCIPTKDSEWLTSIV
ncbi:hypothetical protein EJ03DRAFT_17007 [Teratosphaeria nubilosa]|uniref:Uncharacterized protein n=1 Tax=Teratosphaeria nubilosa TaxID=161662 RepID=A0A6G1KWV7_9PEZI|nr:hypothetical protein EJ03DRAFT_17007 [Teratosphaeria nubilosa]